RAPLAIVAPAFPASGRTVLEGKIRVHEVPLEDTLLWAREHTYGTADLPKILNAAGLQVDWIALDVVRAGCDAVLGRLQDAERRGVDAVVCDGAADTDLAVIAAASLKLGEAVWVGSAGLAAALAESLSQGQPSAAPVQS